MGKPVVQLCYCATVAFSHWMLVEPTHLSTFNGWMKLWHGTTIVP